MAGFSDTTPQYAYLLGTKLNPPSNPFAHGMIGVHLSTVCVAVYHLSIDSPCIGWVMQGDIYPWIQTEERYKIGPFENISVTSEAGSPSWDVTHGSWHAADWLQQIIPGCRRRCGVVSVCGSRMVRT
jgi:hypothetical protein